MALDVGNALKNPGQVYSFDEAVELPEMEILGDPVRFEGVDVTGEYFCTGDSRISLRANVAADVHTRCSRCLEPVQEPLRAEIDALYAKEPDPEDPDLYTFEAHALVPGGRREGRAAAGAAAAILLQAGLQGPVPRLRRQPEPQYLHMPGGQRCHRPLFGIERLCAK